MTPAEICSLSQATLEKVQVLKQQFDLIFENLLLSGSKADLDIAEGLRSQIERELQHLPIAWSLERVSDTTRIYIGKLEPGIFDQLPDSIESIYTSFPEGEIYFEDLEIGGKNTQELGELVKSHGLDAELAAMDLIDRLSDSDSAPLKNSKNLKLVNLRVIDLGFQLEATMDDILERAQELGLELCPPEVCVHYLLQSKGRPEYFNKYVGMNSMQRRESDPMIYALCRHKHGLALDKIALWKGRMMNSRSKFLFSLPKKT